MAMNMRIIIIITCGSGGLSGALLAIESRELPMGDRSLRSIGSRLSNAHT